MNELVSVLSIVHNSILPSAMSDHGTIIRTGITCKKNLL